MKSWVADEMVRSVDLNGNFKELTASIATQASATQAAIAGLANPPKLKVGGTGWLEAMIGATELNATITALNQVGGPGVVTATRTSDAGPNSTGSLGAWAGGDFAINDNTSQVQTAYGRYIEVRRKAGAGTLEGMEIGTINQGDVKTAGPATWGFTGQTIGLLIGAGRGDVFPNNNPTIGLLFAGNVAPGAQWESGIIFGSQSLNPAGHDGYNHAIAMDMWEGHSLLWRNTQDGAPASWIRSDVSVNDLTDFHGGNIVFKNEGLHIAANAINGATLDLLKNIANLSPSLFVQFDIAAGRDLTVNTGKLKLSAIQSFASVTAAQAAGLSGNTVFFNTTTQALSVA